MKLQDLNRVILGYGTEKSYGRKIRIKITQNGMYHFSLLAGNGKVIRSSKMYESKSAAVMGIRAVQINARFKSRFEQKDADDGSLYFVLKTSSGKPIGWSETYTTKASMENGIASVAKNASSKVLVDEEGNEKPIGTTYPGKRRLRF